MPATVGRDGSVAGSLGQLGSGASTAWEGREKEGRGRKIEGGEEEEERGRNHTPKAMTNTH